MLNLDEKSYQESKKPEPEFVHHRLHESDIREVVSRSFHGIQAEIDKNMESYNDKLQSDIQEKRKIARDEHDIIKLVSAKVKRGLASGELTLNSYGCLDAESSQKVIKGARSFFSSSSNIRYRFSYIHVKGSSYDILVDELVNEYLVDRALHEVYFNSLTEIINLIKVAQVNYVQSDTQMSRLDEMRNYMEETGDIFAPHLVEVVRAQPMVGEEIDEAYLAYKEVKLLRDALQETINEYRNIAMEANL